MPDPLDPVEALEPWEVLGHSMALDPDGMDLLRNALDETGLTVAALAALPAPEEGTGWWCTEDCACPCGDDPSAAPVPEGVPEDRITTVALHPVLVEPFTAWLASRGLELSPPIRTDDGVSFVVVSPNRPR